MKKMEKKNKFVKMFNAVAVAVLIASGACVATSCGGETKTEGAGQVAEKTDSVTTNADETGDVTSEVIEEAGEKPTGEGTPLEYNDGSEDVKNEKAEATDKKETAKAEEKRVAKEINDADGWTCVRKEPNAKSTEMFRVKPEQKFYVTKIEGSKWCKFYWTEDGKQEGYIHGSFIKNVGEKKTPINEYKATGKYHVIIGSFEDYKKAKAKFEQIDKWADAEMFYQKDKKTYRVSVYSSTDKGKAENVKADVSKDGYPDAWILKY